MTGTKEAVLETPQMVTGTSKAPKPETAPTKKPESPGSALPQDVRDKAIKPAPAPEAPKTPAADSKKPATKESLEVPEAKKICVEQKIMWPEIEDLLQTKFDELDKAQYAVENAKSLYLRMYEQLDIVETDMRRLRNLLISVDTTEIKLAKPLNLCPIGKKADKLEGVKRKII